MSVILSTAGGSLYDVTFCLAAWSHVPSGGVSLTETSLDRDPLDNDQPPGQRTPPDRAPPPQTETPCTVKSGRYASYWNAFLLFTHFKGLYPLYCFVNIINIQIQPCENTCELSEAKGCIREHENQWDQSWVRRDCTVFNFTY